MADRRAALPRRVWDAFLGFWCCEFCGLPRGYHSPGVMRPPLNLRYHRFNKNPFQSAAEAEAWLSSK